MWLVTAGTWSRCLLAPHARNASVHTTVNEESYQLTSCLSKINWLIQGWYIVQYSSHKLWKTLQKVTCLLPLKGFVISENLNAYVKLMAKKILCTNFIVKLITCYLSCTFFDIDMLDFRLKGLTMEEPPLGERVAVSSAQPQITVQIIHSSASHLQPSEARLLPSLYQDEPGVAQTLLNIAQPGLVSVDNQLVKVRIH